MLNTCLFWGVQAFFILHSEVQFFLPYLLRWCYVILDNFPSGSWFTKFSRVTYLNPSFSIRSRDLFNQSIFLLELYWVIFHLQPSLRNVAICGAYQWSNFLLLISVKFSSLCWSQSNQLFPLVVGCHLIILRCFP